MKIGIWGHYHGGNLGDEVVVATLIHNIRLRQPDAQIIGISLGPEDTSARHGIPAVSMKTGEYYGPEDDGGSSRSQKKGGLFESGLALVDSMASSEWRVPRKIGYHGRRLGHIFRSFRRLQPLDTIIVAGSGPVFDGWTGPWEHPYNMFKWSQLARLSGTDFTLSTVGAGPIHARLSQLLLRAALNSATYRSFRDPSSLALVESMGIRGPNYVFPDLAFSLNEDVVETSRRRALDRGETRIIGISTMAHEDPKYKPEGEKSKYENYLRKLADFAGWLLGRGYRIQLLRSQVRADDRATERLIDLVRERRGDISDKVLIRETETYRDVIDQIVPCDLVVGGRFHCHVLPFLLEKPVLGMAYHQKTFDLMDYMGQSLYCLDIDDADVDAMIDRFKQLMNHREEVRRELAWRVRACKEALALQYDVLFGECSMEDLEGRKYHLPGYPGYRETDAMVEQGSSQ